MPIPLIPILIVASGLGTGVYKGAKAIIKKKKASKINNDANEIINEAKGKLNYFRKMSSKALETLGLKKANVLDSNINRFVKDFEKIKNIELKDSIGIQEAQKIKIDKMTLKEMSELGSFGTSVLAGMGTGALGGALTAFGAYSGAGWLATASTGTAISSLSGAAATNATLAFFGGGSLAAGGLGIAGGAVVLGGLVAAPTLVIMGFIIDAKAQKDVEDALKNIAIARKNAEEMNFAADMCQAIKKRSELFTEKLTELDNRFLLLLKKLEDILNNIGTDYNSFSETDKGVVASTVALAVSIKSIIDTPLLTKEGKLTNESLEKLNSL